MNLKKNKSLLLFYLLQIVLLLLVAIGMLKGLIFVMEWIIDTEVEEIIDMDLTY